MPPSPTIILPPGYDHVPERAVLYCDESGNSGSNYLDLQQPFYVLAGWVVPDSSNEAAWVAVERARERISPQADELKSRSVLRGERQKLDAVQLFKEFGRLGAIPLYLIAEKRFCVAGKIVETFLDPAFNPLLRNGITGDRETKKEIANQLYERLPDPALTQFAEAYRQPDAANLLGAVLRTVAAAARQFLSPELADALLGSEGDILAIAEAEATTSQPGSVEASLNMPCLVSFLMMAEALGRVGLHQPIRFVHDRQHTYEAGYRKIFELHRGMPRLFTALPGDEIPWGRLEAVAEFETADSKQRLPVQAADALAGTVNHLMRLSLAGATPTDADIELAKLTLPGLLVTDVKVAWPIWSDQCIGKVAKSLIMKAIRTPERSEDAIAKARAVAEAKDAPALPIAGVVATGPKFKIPSPMFALRGVRTGNLMVLEPHPSEVEASNGKAQTVVPMFSTQAGAQRFLAVVTKQPEPHEVASFDGPELLQLVEKLDECASHAELVVFDPATDAMQHLYLPSFLESMRAIFGRIQRLIGTGLDRVVLQRSTVAGREATSMLLSDGRYGAMWAPVGEVVVGSTRDEALAALAAAMPEVEAAGQPGFPLDPAHAQSVTIPPEQQPPDGSRSPESGTSQRP